MSFREKRALITLIAVGLVTVAYAAAAFKAPPASVIGAVPGLVGSMILLISIMMISHIVLVIVAGAKEARRPSDERDRLIDLSSRRNAGWIGQAGLWIIFMLALGPAPHLTLAYGALGAFVLAELVLYASQLFYYRRGV